MNIVIIVIIMFYVYSAYPELKDILQSQKFITNTNDLYIHYMDKSTGTPYLEEKKIFQNCGNKDMHVLKKCISISVATVLKCMKGLNPYVQVISVW